MPVAHSLDSAPRAHATNIIAERVSLFARPDPEESATGFSAARKWKELLKKRVLVTIIDCVLIVFEAVHIFVIFVDDPMLFIVDPDRVGI